MIRYCCPVCLGSSGVLADGKGTVCNYCNGKGFIGKTLIFKLKKELGSLIDVKLLA